jgi:hypothetical protein
MAHELEQVFRFRWSFHQDSIGLEGLQRLQQALCRSRAVMPDAKYLNP